MSAPGPLTETSFEPGARRVLSRVRGAYGDLLEAIGSPARAADVQAKLGLDKKLAWRVHRVATCVDPLEGATFVPSPTSARRVARAARDLGVAEPATRVIVDATEAFERFLREHAEDRASFEAMTAAVAGRGLESILDEARRAAFRANVLLHGKFSESTVFGFVVAPGRTPDHLDAISLRGHLGLQRLRPDASVELARHRYDTAGQPSGNSRPLDPKAAESGDAPLLPTFCSEELPELLVATNEDGFRRTSLAGPDLGIRGALDFVLGEAIDDFPLDGGGLGSLCEVATPSKRLVHEVLIHRDLPFVAPEHRVVRHRREVGAWPAPDAPGVLPDTTPVVDLGAGLHGAAWPNWSRHAELLHFALDRRGWSPAEFVHYRAVLEYPVLHSVSWLRAGAARA